MSSGDSVVYRPVVRSLRPGRAATFLNSEGEWWSDALHLLECYSRTWGGDGDAVVACSSAFDVPDPFWPLLQAFDPDQWCVLQRTRRGLKLANPQRYEAQLQAEITRHAAKMGRDETQIRTELESGTNLGAPMWGPIPAALQERISRWFAPRYAGEHPVTKTFRPDEPPPDALVDMCQLTTTPDVVHLIDGSSLTPELQVLLASRTGGLASSHRERLEEAGARIEIVSLAGVSLRHVVEFAWTGTVDIALNRLVRESGVTQIPDDPAFADPGFAAQSPLMYSRLGCDWFTRLRPGLDSEPVIVVCGTTAEDFCYAHTRQRVCRSTFWFPSGPDGADTEVGSALRDTFTRILERYSRSPGDNPPIKFVSLSLEKDAVEALVAQLRATTYGAGFTEGELGRLELMYDDLSNVTSARDITLLDKEHIPKVQWEPFIGPDLAKTLEVPLPSVAAGVRPESCRWQIDAAIPDHVLPPRSAITELLSVDPDDSWALRSSRSGISVDSHGRIWQYMGSPLSQMLVQVRLRFPEAAEIFSELLKPSNATLEPSDKGLYAERMETLWGGLSPLAGDLKTKSTSQLLASWVSKEVDVDLGRIHQGRKFLRLSDVMRIAEIKIDEARDLIDRYVSAGIATRGLVLRCARCKAAGFYPLQDVGEDFRCLRCRQSNELVRAAWRDGREPQWFYGLDEVAYHGLVNNAKVPLLALDELARGAQSFLHMSEAKVYFESGDEIEMDLWAIADGRIVIGEAKVGDRVEKSAADEASRLALMRDLALQMTADEVVFASATKWRQETRTRADSIIGNVVPIRYLEELGKG